MDGPLPEQRILRQKISGEMAFPLGFELLEQAFGDLPQWKSFEFWFEARPQYWASDFTKTLKKSQPYPIVCIRHCEARYLREKSSAGFSIFVYPVKRELKSIARESFFSSALDEFRRFILAEPSSPNFRDIRQGVFNPIAHTCTVHHSNG
jgi:hypothetical protein